MSHQVQKRLLFDWHVPGFLDEVRLDVPAYLAAVDRIRPDTILLMAKSAFGCTYYDDAFGYRNAALHQDLFADLVGPLQARGVEVVAYYNITLNDAVAAEHPEWHQVDPDGSPVIKFDYHQMCMNSPYRDLIIAMMADLAGKYPIDGLWFDITYVHEPGCFCAYCREEYARETGQDLTPGVGAEPAANARFQAFRRDTRRRFLEDAVARLRQVRPGLRFGWNHAGDPLFSESEADRSADWHSMEFHPPFFARGGVNARVMRALGKPRELMLPESLGSWGDWTVQAPQTMRTMVAIAAAQGASPTVGHVAFPTGDLGGQVADGVVETIATAFRLLEERRPWCVDAESVPVGAVLHSEEDFRAPQAAGGLQRLPRGASTLYGAAELLGDCAIPYDILSERMLDRLGTYEFLVVPEVGYLSEQAGEALRQYVREGGCLLASGPTSLADALGQVKGFSLQDLLGVEYVEASPYSLNYVEVSSPQLAEGLPRMPILAKAGPSSPHVVPVRPSLRVRAAEGQRRWAPWSTRRWNRTTPVGTTSTTGTRRRPTAPRGRLWCITATGGGRLCISASRSAPPMGPRTRHGCAGWRPTPWPSWACRAGRAWTARLAWRWPCSARAVAGCCTSSTPGRNPRIHPGGGGVGHHGRARLS